MNDIPIPANQHELPDDGVSESHLPPIAKPYILRRATLGDKGYVLCAISHNGDGLLQLAIQTQPGEIALLGGEWGSIQQIVGDHLHQPIEVIRCRSCGCLSIQPIQEDEHQKETD